MMKRLGLKSCSLIFGLGLLSCLSGEEIKVVLNPETLTELDTLVILFPSKVTVSAGQTSFKYEIVNRSSENIFAVLESQNVEAWKELEVSGERGKGVGGRFSGGYSTHESLRLLYAPRRTEDGAVSEGEDDLDAGTVAEVKFRTGDPEDLPAWTAGKGILRLMIYYYVDGSKDRRVEELAVPIEFQDADPAE